MNKDSIFGLGKSDRGKLVQEVSSVDFILDPMAFKNFISNLGIEPIETVKKRLEEPKTVQNLQSYVGGSQRQNDVTRIQFELEDKDRPIHQQLGDRYSPEYIRRLTGADKVYNFYTDLALGKKEIIPQSFKKLQPKFAMLRILKEAYDKLRGFPEYLCALDELSWKEGLKMENSLSDRLYKLSSRLPPKYSKRLKRLAATIEHPEIQDPGRSTTKGDYKLSKMFAPGENYKDSLKKVDEMSKAKDGDTYKDSRIKELYKGFLAILKNESTTPLSEGKKVDDVVQELTDAVKVTEGLIAKIEKYKRRYTN
jgi:hypothetical protein